ncbi:MAG: restriction endonuclease subunit S [Cyanobacteria bacterium QS_5_48_63]|nr:MAG: restriction endonuclease subunit S [Cyanobacteria bacterium QS_5_48_63]
MSECDQALKEHAVRDATPAYQVNAPERAQGEVPPGYKQTEVGVVPKDWQISNLGIICCFENGDRGNNYPSRSSFALDGIPFINAGHIADGQICLDEMDYITEENYERLGGGKTKPGDILFCLRGTLGKYGVIGTDFGKAAIASSLVIVRPRRDIIIREFLSSYFASEYCDRIIDKWAGGAAQPNLGAQDLKRFTIPLPSLEEQRAIATALSDADALIESLDRLIAKKRAIKQASMQQLLTGEIRLPGFSGAWKARRIEEIAEVDPENLSERTSPRYRFNYISLEQVERGRLLGWTEEEFQSAPSRARRLVRPGDILVSTVRPNLKAHLLFSGDLSAAVCSTGFAVVRCIGDWAVPEFIYPQFLSQVVDEQVDKIIAGSNYPAISGRDVRRLQVWVPSLDEQKAIGATLGDMDEELNALKRRRDKARQLKQGMMQELLTGRTRLVEPEAPAAEEAPA